jgi:hypothetical protein
MKWMRAVLGGGSRLDRRASGDEHEIFLDRANLCGEDFSGRRLRYFGAVGCSFERCRFDGGKIERASFGAGRAISSYVDCSFDGARIISSIGGYARFERCSFRDVDILEWFSFAQEFVECTFSGQLRKGVFNGTPRPKDMDVVHRTRNEFRGNNFSDMNLVDVGFRTGIDLRQQRLPSGPQYVYVLDAQDALRRARGAIAVWRDPALRREGMSLVDLYQQRVEDGQCQLFLRPDTFYEVQGKEAVDRFVALLRG